MANRDLKWKFIKEKPVSGVVDGLRKNVEPHSSKKIEKTFSISLESSILNKDIEPSAKNDDKEQKVRIQEVIESPKNVQPNKKLKLKTRRNFSDELIQPPDLAARRANAFAKELMALHNVVEQDNNEESAFVFSNSNPYSFACTRNLRPSFLENESIELSTEPEELNREELSRMVSGSAIREVEYIPPMLEKLLLEYEDEDENDQHTLPAIKDIKRTNSIRSSKNSPSKENPQWQQYDKKKVAKKKKFGAWYIPPKKWNLQDDEEEEDSAESIASDKPHKMWVVEKNLKNMHITQMFQQYLKVHSDTKRVPHYLN